MSFKEKNIATTLVSFSLILAFFLLRINQLVLNESFIAENVFRLWGIVIVCAVFMTIIAIILTQFGATIWEAILTGDDDPDLEYYEDERDNLIDLRGTQVTYTVSSLGSLVAMATFVFGQPPLVMFSLLIAVGLIAQIVGDLARLAFYRRGI